MANVVISGWNKLILPGKNRPDKAFTSAPKEIVLYDLKADPFEEHDVAKTSTDDVKRLEATQKSAWDSSKPSK